MEAMLLENLRRRSVDGLFKAADDLPRHDDGGDSERGERHTRTKAATCVSFEPD